MTKYCHPILKQIAVNIRAIRIQRNYSQDYVASRLGMSQNGYSKIELGYSNIYVDRLHDIAEALDVGIADLLVTDPQQLPLTALPFKKLQVAGG